ncbi:metallophosphoesterase family protein [Rubripirellula amarantea]|nr:metallophosphoesterase family protein [Rubripirellula amarantea]
MTQCIGLGGRYVFSASETESDIYGFLFFDLGYPEILAQRIDDAGAIICLVAAAVIAINAAINTRLARIFDTVAAISVSSWVITMALAHMVRGGLYAELALGEYAVRIAAPIALVLLNRESVNGNEKHRRAPAMQVMIYAVAATFLVHGYKAVQCYGPFTDLILLTDANTLRLNFEQSLVENALVAIGAIDVLLAGLLLITRLPAIAFYMAFWGALTAISRMTAFGLSAWPETIVRSANAGVPLALAFCLVFTQKEVLKLSMPTQKVLSTFLAVAALGIGAALATSASADAPLQGTQPAHYRVIWTDDPATTATISWSTAERGSDHRVNFHERADPSNQGIAMAASGRFTGGEVELYYHHARLTDLKPSTAYEVQMISDGEESPLLYFETAPSDDRPFSLLHGGDSRSDQKARRGVNAMIAKLVADSHENDVPSDDIIALAHGGDYIVSGNKMNLWSMWLSDHELTIGSDGRMLPIIPARGNHDHGKPFNEVFAFPEDDKNYYGISLGSEVRFVTLNSEISTAGTQAKWLDKELESARGSHRWLLAQYHRPVYPAVKNPGAGLQSWVPLFEKHNVDLVCEADGHNIKRTLPIRNNKHDKTGVVYIGEGGLGVPQRTPKTDRWFLQSPGMADKGDHVFVLTFEADTLTGKCLMVKGDVRDQFVLNRRD